MVSVEPDVAQQAFMLLDEDEPILSMEYVALLDGYGIPGGPAHRRKRSRVIGDLLSAAPGSPRLCEPMNTPICASSTISW